MGWFIIVLTHIDGFVWKFEETSQNVLYNHHFHKIEVANLGCTIFSDTPYIGVQSVYHGIGYWYVLVIVYLSDAFWRCSKHLQSRDNHWGLGDNMRQCRKSHLLRPSKTGMVSVKPTSAAVFVATQRCMCCRSWVYLLTLSLPSKWWREVGASPFQLNAISVITIIMITKWLPSVKGFESRNSDHPTLDKHIDRYW